LQRESAIQYWLLSRGLGGAPSDGVLLSPLQSLDEALAVSMVRKFHGFGIGAKVADFIPEISTEIT
jgi:hypothetical protein